MSRGLPTSRELRGELDWIVMRAIEKDRSRRYESPSALADDIERYLRHEAVEAGPPSTSYRLRKLVRRHRVAMLTAAIIGLGLVVGVTGMVVGLARALDAEADAVAAQAATAEALGEAQRQVETTRAINAFLNEDVLAYTDPFNTPDPDISMRTVLHRAATRINDERESNPLVVAAICNTLGTAYVNLAMYDEAGPILRRAFDVRAEHLGDRHPATLESRAQLASLAYYSGDLERADEVLTPTHAAMRAVLGADDPVTLESANSLAFIRLQRGLTDEASVLFKETIDLLSERGDRDEDLYTTLSNLALLQHRTGEHGEAKASYTRALNGLRNVVGSEHPTAMTCLCNLASLHNDLREFNESEPLLLEAAALQEGVLGPDHRSTLMTFSNLAFVYSMTGRLDDAEEVHDRTLDARRRTLGDSHPHVMLSLVNLADIYRRTERLDLAQLALAEALGVAKATYGDQHLETLWTIKDLADVEMQAGRLAEARVLYTTLVETGTAVLGADHRLIVDGISRLESIEERDGE